MIKRIQPFLKHQKTQSLFGIYFNKIDDLSITAKIISNLYKLLFILYVIIIRILRKFKWVKHTSKITQYSELFYSAHCYGMFIHSAEDEQWILSFCKEKEISNSSRIILGFSQCFDLKKRMLIRPKHMLYEKIVFIFFSSYFMLGLTIIFLYSLVQFLYSPSIVLGFILILFWTTTFYIGLCVISLMKGTFWDPHNIVKQL